MYFSPVNMKLSPLYLVRDDNEFVDTNIPFEKLIDIFKRGFIKYFRERCISK